MGLLSSITMSASSCNKSPHIYEEIFVHIEASLVALLAKNLPAVQETQV